jgi:hypothetical protein
MTKFATLAQTPVVFVAGRVVLHYIVWSSTWHQLLLPRTTEQLRIQTPLEGAYTSSLELGTCVSPCFLVELRSERIGCPVPCKFALPKLSLKNKNTHATMLPMTSHVRYKSTTMAASGQTGAPRICAPPATTKYHFHRTTRPTPTTESSSSKQKAEDSPGLEIYCVRHLPLQLDSHSC